MTMTRQRLDNLTIADIQTISDAQAISRTNYAGSRSIVRLSSLLAVTMQVQITLSQLPNTLTNRTTARLLDMHETNIRKRIAIVERLNENKSNKLRSDKQRGQLFDALLQSGTLTELVKESRAARSEAMKQSKLDAQTRLSSAVPSIQKEFELAGFNPLASSADRAQWLYNQELVKQGLPDTDLNAQGEQALNILQRAEKERQTVPEGETSTNANVTDNANVTPTVTKIVEGLKSINTGDKLGSAEDWLK